MVLFLLLALLIFGYDSITSNPDASQKILLVSTGNIRHLAAGFENTWHRPPSPEELKHLIDERIREEVYYREAIVLHLDQEDTIIRRRLRQKYEFMVEDLSDNSEPGDEELAAFLNAHSEMFRIAAKLAFEQIYLDPGKPQNTVSYIQSLKAQLNNKSIAARDIPGLSDSLMLDFNNSVADERVIDSRFGSGFAKQLMQLPVGSWQGPVASGYGNHLVLVKVAIPARNPSLEEVRGRVLSEWQRTRKQAFLEKNYASLLSKYQVVIESDSPEQGPGK